MQITRTDVGFHIVLNTGVSVVVDRASFPSRLKNKPNDDVEVLAEMEARLQSVFDTRTLRSSLPEDEETKNVDPARKTTFHDGADIISRAVEIDEVWWSADEGVFSLMYRNI